MRYLYQCKRGRRRFGHFLSDMEPSARNLRSQQRRTGWETQIPHTNLECWRRLHLYKIIEVWNNLPFEEADLDPEASFLSLRSFTAALPALYDHLPALLKEKLGFV